MYDRDELYTKVVVLDEMYKFIVKTFLFEIILMSKYISQDFIELIPNKSCSIVTSECVVVVVDLEKLCNVVVHNFFYLKSLWCLCI